MAYRKQLTRLKAPYLKGILLEPERVMDKSGTAQVIMATHSPLLMACPGAQLFRISRFRPDPADFRDTDHFRMFSGFCSDPRAFMQEALGEDDE